MRKLLTTILALSSSLVFGAPVWTEYMFKVDNPDSAAKIIAAGDAFMDTIGTALDGGAVPGITMENFEEVALSGSKVLPASQSSSEPIGVIRPPGVSTTEIIKRIKNIDNP